MSDGEQNGAIDALEPRSVPVTNVVGERVALGPLHRGLLPLFFRWDNDFATADLAGDDPAPRSPQALAVAYEPLLSGSRPDWVGFVIYELDGLRPIGHANVRDFATRHRTAEFGITIGERSCRGKGYGTEATRLVLDYAFTVLGVHNVWLDTASDNHAAIGAYARAGFKEIGRRRQARRFGGRLCDVVLMDCLATEFVPPKKLSLAPL